MVDKILDSFLSFKGTELNDATYLNFLRSSANLLKKMKYVIKNKINNFKEITKLQLLIYESTIHSVKMELESSSKDLEIAKKDTDNNFRYAKEIEKDFKLYETDSTKVNEFIKIFSSNCEEDKKKLQDQIVIKKKELSNAKVVKEYIIRDFKMLIEFVNSESKEDEELEENI